MKRISRIVTAAAVAALLAPAGVAAQGGGILGRVGQAARGAAKASFPIGPEKEREIGFQIAAGVAGRYHVSPDTALGAYVSLVGQVVARQSPRAMEIPFRFAVLDTDEVNAFAAPGGFIFVTRGALAMMESESELAGVLAHEVAHVDQKHVLNQIRRADMLSSARDEADLNGFVLDQLGQAGTSAVFMGLSRGDEMEADSIGMVYAAAAGYRADGLVTFVSRLAADEAAAPAARHARLAAMRATHPPAADRVGALQRQLAAGSSTLMPAQGQVLADRFRRYARRH